MFYFGIIFIDLTVRQQCDLSVAIHKPWLEKKTNMNYYLGLNAIVKRIDKEEFIYNYNL